MWSFTVDTFDDGALGSNPGTGGGAVSSTVGPGTASWSENGGNATYSQAGTTFTRAALLHSSNSFQSNGGFELTVDYLTNNINSFGRNLFSFGLLENADNYATGSNPFVEVGTEYGIGGECDFP